MNKSNWLITGGCGFIGTNLIKHLVHDGGHGIRILDNLSVGTCDDLSRVCDFEKHDFKDLSSALGHPIADSVELLVGDIRDSGICRQAFHGIEIIVHLAANTGVDPSVKNPRLDMETNVIGTLNMLDAARQNGVRRFIFASSGASIGECTPPIHEELSMHPVSPYGASKSAGEAYCSAYFRTFGIETVSLRFGNVYGPRSGRKTSIVAKFIRQALLGKTCKIYGDGAQTRDFIFIDDLVRAICLSAFKEGVGGEIFQIATSKERTVNEVANAIISILKSSGNIDMRIEHGEDRVGDVRRNFSDTTKALKYLGWQAKTDFNVGIRNTIEWFIDESDLSHTDKYLKK
jgi:UDP-glucose 4-epimerase